MKNEIVDECVNIQKDVHVRSLDSKYGFFYVYSRVVEKKNSCTLSSSSEDDKSLY